MATLRVKAIQPGYYGSIRRDPGDKKYGEFVLTSALHFSKSWMEAVDWDVEAEQAKEKAGDGKVKADPAPAKPAPAAQTPIKASVETTVTPPATAPKTVSPITGQDI